MYSFWINWINFEATGRTIGLILKRLGVRALPARGNNNTSIQPRKGVEHPARKKHIFQSIQPNENEHHQ